MKSPYKRIVVYDIEAGGLKVQHNNITEVACVALDAHTLDTIETFSVMLAPWVNMSHFNVDTDAYKEAKILYSNLSVEDDNKSTFLEFGDTKITAIQISELVKPIESFIDFILENYDTGILEMEDVIDVLEEAQYKDVMRLYFNLSYNPVALEVTKIPVSLLVSEGIPRNEAFEQVRDFMIRHKVSNSKPIIAGHNIGNLPRRIVKKKEVKPNGYDNPFMEKWFWENNDDWFSHVNDLILDTMIMARFRWSELPAYNLGTVANELGLTLKGAHRALPDTIANAQVLVKLLKASRGEGGSNASYTRKKYSINF